MKIHFNNFAAVPARFNVGIMLFFACWVNYMLRVNMSVNIIAMVPPRAPSASTRTECVAISTDEINMLNDTNMLNTTEPGQDVFNWTEQQQAYILSSYFWGYAITCLISGTVAEMWGPRMIIFYTMLVTAVLTILTPPAARLNYWILVVSRFIVGLASGFLFPASHTLVARWAPPAEKGKFVSALLGGAVGTVVTWSVSGPLIENFGWSWAFYIPGAIGIAWCALWWYLVYDSPCQHPRISTQEKEFIMQALGDKVQTASKVVPPFKKILTSFPLLAMVVLHYGSLWGLYFLMTAAPKFVSSALGFNLTSTGAVASLPYLARMIFSLIFGAIGDWIVKQNKVSTTFIRKFFCIFSHILPGVLLIAMGYTGCSPILSISLITLSMGLNGAATITNLVNHQDLAPNYAGTLYGIANGIGNTAGFITPLVTAFFTNHGNGFAEWRPVFFTGASLYIFSAIYFMLFGSGETQSWNYIAPTVETAPATTADQNRRTNTNTTVTTITTPAKT